MAFKDRGLTAMHWELVFRAGINKPNFEFAAIKRPGKLPSSWPSLRYDLTHDLSRGK